MHESHIQAHELRVSGELEFGSTDPDSSGHIHTTIRNHSLHGLEFISFLGIYPGILILLSISTSVRAEMINQELHAHIYQ